MDVEREPVITDTIHINHRHLQRSVLVDGRVCEAALDRGVDGGTFHYAAGDGLVDEVAAWDGDWL